MAANYFQALMEARIIYGLAMVFQRIRLRQYVEVLAAMERLRILSCALPQEILEKSNPYAKNMIKSLDCNHLAGRRKAASLDYLNSHVAFRGWLASCFRACSWRDTSYI